ncbi:hypothetical protein EV182_006962, partial [Spiromyces aspiralis]
MANRPATSAVRTAVIDQPRRFFRRTKVVNLDFPPENNNRSNDGASPSTALPQPAPTTINKYARFKNFSQPAKLNLEASGPPAAGHTSASADGRDSELLASPRVHKFMLPSPTIPGQAVTQPENAAATSGAHKSFARAKTPDDGEEGGSTSGISGKKFSTLRGTGTPISRAEAQQQAHQKYHHQQRRLAKALTNRLSSRPSSPSAVLTKFSDNRGKVISPLRIEIAPSPSAGSPVGGERPLSAKTPTSPFSFFRGKASSLGGGKRSASPSGQRWSTMSKPAPLKVSVSTRGYEDLDEFDHDMGSRSAEPASARSATSGGSGKMVAFYESQES